MTNSPSILGGAPPIPGTSAHPPPTGGPTQEDRLLAAAAYLGFLTGFWLVVPIVIYVLKREKSRFVAHHALRAVLLHLIAIPVFGLSVVLGIAVSFGLAIGLESRIRQSHGLIEALFYGIIVAGYVLPWVVYLVVSGLAAVRAFQGRVRPTSLLGRVVEGLLGKDKTVAPAQVSP